MRARAARQGQGGAMTRTARILAAGALGLGMVAAGGRTAPAAQQAGGQPTDAEIVEYHTKNDKAGTPAEGRPLYDKLCGACHIFGGIGREVGPDLTAIASRFRRADILDAIVYPSKVVSDQYQAEMFQLKDGRILSGVPVRESAAVIVIRTAETPEKPVSIPKGQIVERAVSPVSMMPAGLLTGLSHDEIASLLAFLQAPPPAK
jgi:putative heme-binding domain-containing protein